MFLTGGRLFQNILKIRNDTNRDMKQIHITDHIFLNGFQWAKTMPPNYCTKSFSLIELRFKQQFITNHCLFYDNNGSYNYYYYLNSYQQHIRLSAIGDSCIIKLISNIHKTPSLYVLKARVTKVKFIDIKVYLWYSFTSKCIYGAWLNLRSKIMIAVIVGYYKMNSRPIQAYETDAAPNL